MLSKINNFTKSSLGFVLGKGLYSLSFVLLLFSLKTILSITEFSYLTITVLISNYLNFLTYGYIPWYCQIAPKLINHKIINKLSISLRSTQFIIVHAVIFILNFLTYLLWDLELQFILLCTITMSNKSSVNFLINYLRTLNRIKDVFYLNIIISIIYILVVIDIFFQNSLTTINLILTIFFIYQFKFYLPFGPANLTLKSKRFKIVFNFFWMNLTRQFSEKIDQFVFSSLLPLELIGNYNLASIIANGIFIPIQSYQSYLYPKIVIKLKNKVNNIKLNFIYSLHIKTIIPYIIVVFCFLFLFYYISKIDLFNFSGILKIILTLSVIKLISIPRLNQKNILLSLGYIKDVKNLSTLILLTSLSLLGVSIFFNHVDPKIKVYFVYALKFISELSTVLIFSSVFLLKRHNLIFKTIIKIVIIFTLIIVFYFSIV